MSEPLSGTVDVPKVGRVKKIYVYGGVAVVGIAAILWYRNHHGSASTAGQATDPAGNVGQIDPATGFVFGSPQDVDALASMSGPGSSGSSGGGGAGGGGGDGSGSSGSGGPPFQDNAAWYQYAASYMIGTVGLDPGQVSTDLGKYLAGNQVTVAERDAVVEPAIGAAGTPPKAGPNGFPPSINLAGSPSSPGGSVPSVPVLAPGAITDTSAVVKWTPVSGATSYGWSLVGTTRHGTVTDAAITLTALSPSTSYQVKVHANNSAGKSADATITVKTRAASGDGSTTQPAGSYAAVTVVEFTTVNPAWNSTLSGIARHYGYGSDWASIWDDPKNARERELRGSPTNIRKGDTIYVKRK